MTDVPTNPPHRWAFVLCLAALMVAAIATVADAQPVSAARLPHIYALSTDGKVLPPGSHLRAGQQVTIVADGFARKTAVEVVDASRKIVTHVRADRNGVATTRFVAPNDVSAPRPLVVLAAPEKARQVHGGNGNGSGTAAQTGVDPQTLSVVAPLVRQFPYVPGPNHQVDSGSTGGHHPGSGTGGLANTGFDIVALIIAAIVAIVLGWLSLLAARRRRGSLQQV